MRLLMNNIKMKKVFSLESFIFLLLFFGLFGYLSSIMGLSNMMNTLMNTAYALLIDTVFYIMAISVLAGAIGGIFTEFGVIAILNKLLSPLMKPLFGLPGASAIGILSTFLSDNPAILALAEDPSFKRYFKKYQLPALTNLGTGFGMGLIVVTFMIGLHPIDDSNFALAACMGLLGACIGSLISVRIMLHFTKKEFDIHKEAYEGKDKAKMVENMYMVREGSIANRAMNALLEGGKQGVSLGLEIIPGVLIICTLVMMLTNSAPETGFTGAAYEGVYLLPKIANSLSFILTPLFGFTSPECISVPITALGSSGASIGLIPGLVQSGLASGNDIAVFTAMCMCFSGYLSTHVAMMSVLGFPKLTGKSILSHTIGGLCAGMSAHFLYVLVTLF